MRRLVHLVALLAGLVAGLAAAVVHRADFPLGGLLVVAEAAAVAVALVGSRRPGTAASYALGWLVVFAGVLLGRPEGDFVVAGDPAGWILIGTALGHGLLLLVSIAVARGRRT